jgi:hypothetical protein
VLAGAALALLSSASPRSRRLVWVARDQPNHLRYAVDGALAGSMNTRAFIL